MKRAKERLALLSLTLLCLAASSCFGGGNYTVGYGYTGSDYYGDVFYRSSMDRAAYGFYGRP